MTRTGSARGFSPYCARRESVAPLRQCLAKALLKDPCTTSTHGPYPNSLQHRQGRAHFGLPPREPPATRRRLGVALDPPSDRATRSGCFPVELTSQKENDEQQNQNDSAWSFGLDSGSVPGRAESIGPGQGRHHLRLGPT